MDKKGTHIGMILSFVIFVTAVFFLISMLAPNYKESDAKKNILGYLDTEIEKKISIELISQTISLEGNYEENCVELEDLLGHEGFLEKFVVEDSDKNNLISKQKNSDVFLENGKSFLRFYFSEGFYEVENEELEDCESFYKDTGENNYTLHLQRIEKYYFLPYMENLIQEVNESESYEDLKREFNLPENVEFGFGIKYENGTIKLGNEREIKTNLFALEKPINYINQNATVESGFIRIIVW